MALQSAFDANEGQSKSSFGARFNAVTHGLTAKTIVLPNEDFKAFRAKTQEFKDSLETRTPLEDDLAERAAEASWRLTRANLAEKARVVRTMVLDRKATARTEQIEALELIERLFSDRRGPAELYPAGNYNYNKAPRTSWPKAASDDDNPARLVILLESTLAGCQLLQARWKSLLDLVDSKQGWQSYEKFRATRLLGWQPLSAFSEREVTEMYLACHAIAPQHANAFQELRSEVEEEPFEHQMALLKKRNLEAITPANSKAARAVLRGIVEKAIERLRMLEAEHQNFAEFLDGLQDDILSVEETKPGAGVRRLQDACNRLLIRNVEAVQKCRRSDAAGWGKTRQERERRRAKSGGSSSQDGIVTNPADQRLVLDEDGKIRPVYGFTGNVEEGLARYAAEVGPQPYPTTNSGPEINENEIPRVSDFARWAPPMDHSAQRDRPNIQNEIVDIRWALEASAEIVGQADRDDDERRRIEDQILKADSGFVNKAERVAEHDAATEADHVEPDDVATMELTAQRDRANVQNKINATEAQADETVNQPAGEVENPQQTESNIPTAAPIHGQQLPAPPDVAPGDAAPAGVVATMGLPAQEDRANVQNKINAIEGQAEQTSSPPVSKARNPRRADPSPQPGRRSKTKGSKPPKWDEAGSAGTRRDVPAPKTKAPSSRREDARSWISG